MDDGILLFLEKLLIILLVPVVYLYLISRVFPFLTMRLRVRFPRSSAYPEGDRGLRRVKFADGRAVIYEPAPKMRPYMPRYALIKRDGCTYFKGELHVNVSHVRYDVVAYNSRGRLLDVLGVKELVTERGSTRAVRLPRDTAYARVILRKVDGMYADNSPILGYNLVGMAILAGLSTLASLITGLLIYDSLREIIELLGGGEIMPFILFCPILLILSGLSTLWILWRYRVRRGKVLNA